MSSEKKILVLGATGPTGILFVKKALEHGHNLTLYVRNESKIPEDVKSHSKVKIVNGQLYDEDLLSSAVNGQDMIVSLIGANSLSNKPGTFSNAYRTLFAAMKKYNVKRVLGLGTISIPDAKDHFSLTVRLIVFLVWSVAYSAWKEVVSVGKVFDEEADGLDWTLFRVAGLANGEDVNVTTTYVNGPGFAMSINRAGIAKWLVDQVESEEPQFVGEKPYICTKGIKPWDVRP